MNLFFGQTDAAAWSRPRRWADAILRRLGPGWRAAPVRKLVQTASLALLLVLFLVAADALGPDASIGPADASEPVPVEAFLWLDPLVGVSTAIAARTATTALWVGAGILAVCLVFPRGFCGYVCPLGTLIDTFDWLVGRRASRWHVTRRGGWPAVRFGVLAAVLVAAALGVVLTGYAAAIPVLTRGLALSAGRAQMALARGWDQVPTMGASAWAAVALLAAVLLVGLLGRRFWCRTLCPTGALLSLASVLRLTERRVGEACIGCGRCRQACAFDAVRDDFTTRPLECTFCQACGGACPVGAIDFTWRAAKAGRTPAPAPRSISRRALLAGSVVGAAAAAGMRYADPGGPPLLRPPGAVEEPRFLALCVRCGECVKVCPGPVLRPAGLEGGLAALWTPVAVPSVAGCHQECNACTRACPTGAIRPLTLARKRRTVMGRAVVDTATCLAHAGERECRLCFDVCRHAGYDAIRQREIRLEVGEVPEGAVSEAELEAMGRILAPFVDADACTGCGQCENRCHAAYVERERVLAGSAIAVRDADRGKLLPPRPASG